MLQVDVRRRKKRVDANLGRTLQGFPGPIDVLRARPGQTADRRAFDLLRDAPDGLEIARRAVGEACLDDVDAEPRQLFGDHDFLLHVHAGARGLFPIPQRRIKDSDHARHRVTPSVSQKSHDKSPHRLTTLLSFRDEGLSALRGTTLIRC